MISLPKLIRQIAGSSPDRRLRRGYLKAARRGDAEAYLALCANYLDLAVIYLGTCVREPAETRAALVEQIFIAIWQHLKCTDRLSDFEFLFAQTLLESASKEGPIGSPEPIVTRMRVLDPRARLAFLAYDLENWPTRWVALLMRDKTEGLHRLLAEARCELCGIGWESLAPEERECLQALSRALEASPNLRVQRAIAQRIAAFPKVGDIRSLWLELRPQCVEVRHRFRPAATEREAMLGTIYAAVSTVPMLRPVLVDRVVNTVHFSRHAKIKVS
jgi:hypothetical protein